VSTGSELTLSFSSVFGHYVAHMLDLVLLKTLCCCKDHDLLTMNFLRPENYFF